MMEIFASFVVGVAAGIVANCIYDWIIHCNSR